MIYQMASYLRSIREASAANPIDILNISPADEQSDSITFSQMGEQSGYRFLPPPLLDESHVAYVGSMSACGMLKQAGRADLATAFLQAMVSEDALDYGTFAVSEQLVSKNPPKYMYLDENGDYTPAFSNQDDALAYRVSAGRNIPVVSFVYSESAFAVSQDFREKLSIDTFLMGRDFYDSAWAYFQEWYPSVLSAAELDGASKRQLLCKIELPLLRHVITFAIIYLLMNGVRVFRESYLLYGGYPPTNLFFVQHYINGYFARLDYSLLSSAAVVFSHIVLALFYIIWSILRKGDCDEK